MMCRAILAFLTGFLAGCVSESLPAPAGFTTESTLDAQHATKVDVGHVTICAHDGCIDAVAFAPNRDEIATCGMDKAVRFWNSRTGAFVRGFRTKSRVMSIVYSSDGQLLAVGAQDDGVHYWSTENWSPRMTTKSQGDPETLAFSPDSAFLAVGGRPLELIRVDDWTVVREQEAHEEGGTCVAFSPNGKLLASGNADGFAKIWSVPQIREQLRFKHDDWVGAIAFTSDGQHIVTSSMRRNVGTQTTTITFRRSDDGTIENELRGQTIRGQLHCDTSFALSLNGRYVVATLRGSIDTGVILNDQLQTEEVGDVSLWDLDAKRLVATNAENRRAYGVSFSRNSDQFAVVDVDGNLEIWDVNAFIAQHPPSVETKPDLP